MVTLMIQNKNNFRDYQRYNLVDDEPRGGLLYKCVIPVEEGNGPHTLVSSSYKFTTSSIAKYVKIKTDEVAKDDDSDGN
jgi:hypothetical protein